MYKLNLLFFKVQHAYTYIRWFLLLNIFTQAFMLAKLLGKQNVAITNLLLNSSIYVGQVMLAYLTKYPHLFL